MSGGLVIDEEGRLCGLVCAGTEFADPDTPPLSYAATLSPISNCTQLQNVICGQGNTSI
jgi:hypothetical protein